MTEKPLGTLLADLGCTLTKEVQEALARVTVRGLALDSRGEDLAGALFLARRGAKIHGLWFAPEAFRRGAAAVLYDPEGAPRVHIASPPPLRWDRDTVYLPGPSGPLVSLPGLDARLGEIARRFYGETTRDLALTAVTGTNGKTTVAWLLARAWRALIPGQETAYLGTVGVDRGEGGLVPLERTTPDVIAMHKWCARLHDKNVRRLVCEASSHALVQGRLDGLRVQSAVFTNLSPEHLDYHASLEAYREAKWRLFARSELRGAAVNVGDECGRLFAARLAGGPRPFVLVRFTTGAEEAEFRAENVVAEAEGTRFDLLGPRGERRRLRSGLLGLFNVENLLAVAASLHAEGVEWDRIAAVLPGLTPPPGRLEFVRPRRGPTVVVDFAHTPAALAAVLDVCRRLTRGRLFLVFGCGGERDRGKRPIMGKLAAAHAGRIILTDDNPRGEDPGAIAAEILAGMPPGDPRVSVVHDRGQAIARALEEARAGDLVLVAGKGHEDTQVYGEEAQPFSDLAVVRACLSEGDLPC